MISTIKGINNAQSPPMLHHCSHPWNQGLRGDALRRRLLRRGSRTAAIPDASVLRSQHSPHLSLPPAPVGALARRRTGGLPHHRLRTSTFPCLTGRRARAARPADTVFLPQAPIPSDPVLLAGESSNHAFLLISPMLFRVSSIMNKNLADVVFLESFTSY
jgi:hypothetical protein